MAAVCSLLAVAVRVTIVYAHTTGRAASRVLAQVAPGDEDPVFSKVYAQVNTTDGQVPVYATPADAAAGTNPVRELNGNEWVTVASTAEISGVALAQIKANEWVAADKLKILRPSRFTGQTFDQTPDHPIAWVISSFQPALEPAGDLNPAAPTYERYTVLTIYEKALVGETLWYRIGDGQWCRQERLALVTARRAPVRVNLQDRLHGKWISVNLFEQTIAAYEGERLVYASLISSGLPQWETVKGIFQIQYKSKSQPMYNAAGDPALGDYYVESVPYNMFFFQDYALHGAYWHDGFGYRHSRGCVNLSLNDARWFFNWSLPTPNAYGYAQANASNPGTWVWVH
ncbi:MAG TPA: L,D-transpeptidase [Anaerolineae bacterium]